MQKAGSLTLNRICDDIIVMADFDRQGPFVYWQSLDDGGCLSTVRLVQSGCARRWSLISCTGCDDIIMMADIGGCIRGDLNFRPSGYKTDALRLSYECRFIEGLYFPLSQPAG